MYLKRLYRSFYIVLGKGKFTVRCFETEDFITISSEIGINNKWEVVQIGVLDTNLNLENWMNGVPDKKTDFLNHPRVIADDFLNFSETLKKCIKVLKKKWWLEVHTFVFQLDYEPLGGITDNEIRFVKDVMEQAGAKLVYIISDSSRFNKEKAFNFYKYFIAGSRKMKRKMMKENSDDFLNLLQKTQS